MFSKDLSHLIFNAITFWVTDIDWFFISIDVDKHWRVTDKVLAQCDRVRFFNLQKWIMKFAKCNDFTYAEVWDMLCFNKVRINVKLNKKCKFWCFRTSI